MAPILRLPDELLLNIAESLCAHCQNLGSREAPNRNASTSRENKTTLSRLIQVCDRFQRIFEPFLYHYFCPEDLNKREVNNELAPFLETILRRPDLVTAVKVLSLVPGFIPKDH